MAWTGYDPPTHGGPIDMTGGGLDPSYAWALAPGGRFPGDEWMYLEYLASLDPAAARGDVNGPNPDYKGFKLPDWMAKNSKGAAALNRLLAWHAANVREGGTMSPGDPLGSGGNSFHSGPGADYGPLSGPTRGLVDQYGNIFDGPDHRPPGTSESEGGGRGGRGGGGGYNGPSGMELPNAPTESPSFLAWQPSNHGQPIFGGPAAGSRNVALPPKPPAKPAKKPKGHGTPPFGSGGGKGGPGAGSGLGGAPGGSGGGKGTLADAARELGIPDEDIQKLLAGILSLGTRKAGGQDLGGAGFKGYNINDIEGNAPGHLKDPTAGVYDTSGMPNPTLPAQATGEHVDDYMRRLHDWGFDSGDIRTAVGSNPSAGPDGWGMQDTVVRGWNSGYHFGNFATPGEAGWDEANGIMGPPRELMSGSGGGGISSGTNDFFGGSYMPFDI